MLLEIYLFTTLALSQIKISLLPNPFAYSSFGIKKFIKAKKW
jgi:hypothetical protein